MAPAPARGMFVDVHVQAGDLESVKRLRRLVDTATTAHDKMVTDDTATSSCACPRPATARPNST